MEPTIISGHRGPAVDGDDRQSQADPSVPEQHTAPGQYLRDARLETARTAHIQRQYRPWHRTPPTLASVRVQRWTRVRGTTAGHQSDAEAAADRRRQVVNRRGADRLTTESGPTHGGERTDFGGERSERSGRRLRKTRGPDSRVGQTESLPCSEFKEQRVHTKIICLSANFRHKLPNV